MLKGRILVTGHRGFIGSALFRRLQDSGSEVWGSVRSGSRSGTTILKGGLSSLPFCRDLLRQARPDYVFHLAGHPFGARAVELVEPTFRDNLTTTVNLLTAATEQGVTRFVTAGSLEEPDDRQTMAAPSSPYAASKMAASMYARMFHSLYELPVVIARIFMVYGPGQSEPTKLIPSTISALRRGEAPEISSGERPIDWIYVEDVVEGLIRAAAIEGIEGRTVELGTGVLTTVRDVVERLARLIPDGRPPIFGAVPDRKREQIRVADTMATTALLGWRPEVDLEEGLRRTVDWHMRRRDA